MHRLSPSAARAREELVAGAARASDVGELFAVASRQLQRMVSFDAAIWMTLDPATHLPTAPTRMENLGHACGGEAHSHLRVWELELLVEDINLYRDLARAATPAAGLRMTTDDRPARSSRFREVLAPAGFGDELRAVLRIDGSSWASVGLFRAPGRPAFQDDETELLADLSRPLAAAVRQHARPAAPGSPIADTARGPGLLIFAPTGELVSINDDGRAWLQELPAEPVTEAGLDISLPVVVAGTLMRARAIAEERDRGAARARVRSRATGRWLVFHATCLRDADGDIGNSALVIEPASASQVAPIVTQAYELSAREQEITALIARGLGTAEIAARLYLSVHTVRDYVKAIFEKVGVSSRGALVARLFAEHYLPIHAAPGSHDCVD
jgi:DNA-binding CsgD family transcriptional regulator